MVYDIPKKGHNEAATHNAINDKEMFEKSAKKTEKFTTFKTDKSRRQKRDVIMQMQERTVETMIVVDKMMYEFHRTENVIEPYVLTIMNIVR
jgi:hypothetical protein